MLLHRNKASSRLQPTNSRLTVYILSSQDSVVGKKIFITPRYAQTHAKKSFNGHQTLFLVREWGLDTILPVLMRSWYFIYIFYDDCKIFITPRYAQSRATFISPVTSFNDTSIYFGPGSDRDRLLEVPLIPARRFTTNDSIAIQITAVFNGSMLNERDRDPEVGITDGNNRNMFWIADINNYPRYPPCIPKHATGSPSKTLASSTTSWLKYFNNHSTLSTLTIHDIASICQALSHRCFSCFNSHLVL